jgi:hypothetical protein
MLVTELATCVLSKTILTIFFGYEFCCFLCFFFCNIHTYRSFLSPNRNSVGVFLCFFLCFFASDSSLSTFSFASAVSSYFLAREL